MEGFGEYLKLKKIVLGQKLRGQWWGRCLHHWSSLLFQIRTFITTRCSLEKSALWDRMCSRLYLQRVPTSHPCVLNTSANTCLCWCEYMSIWVVVKFLTVCGSRFTSRVAEMATLNSWRVCDIVVSVTISMQMRRGDYSCTNKEMLTCKLGFFRESRQRDIYIPCSPSLPSPYQPHFKKLIHTTVVIDFNQVYRISIHFVTCPFPQPRSEGFMLSEVHTQQRITCLFTDLRCSQIHKHFTKVSRPNSEQTSEHHRLGRDWKYVLQRYWTFWLSGSVCVPGSVTHSPPQYLRYCLPAVSLRRT